MPAAVVFSLTAAALTAVCSVPQCHRALVVRHGRCRVTSVRRAVAASTLVEQHDLKRVGVEPLVAAAWSPRSRSAVHDQYRPTMRVAPGLPIHAVALTDVEQPVVVHLRLG